MILCESRILEEIKNGNISISNFNENRLNPNSYNLRLGNELKIYDYSDFLDCKKPNKTTTISIDEKDGYILKPGILYLASTMEKTETHKFVPMLEGRSSLARLGVQVHQTAGFGDVGFTGCWTLEIIVTHPVKIYPGMEICQIYYQTVDGECEEYNLKGKYNNSQVQPSLLYKDFYPNASIGDYYIIYMKKNIGEFVKDLISIQIEVVRKDSNDSVLVLNIGKNDINDIDKFEESLYNTYFEKDELEQIMEFYKNNI